MILERQEFRLDKSKCNATDIDVYALEDMERGRKVQHYEMLMDFSDCQVEFDTAFDTIYIKHRGARNAVPTEYGPTDTVQDLIKEVRHNIGKYNVPDHDRYIMGKPNSEILIYTKFDTFGAENRRLRPPEKISDLSCDTLEFAIELAIPPVTKDDVIKEIIGQSIALFGPPGHGKSSTINTFVKAFHGGYQVVQSHPSGHTASRVYSPYVFKSGEAGNCSFTIYDVPGLGLEDILDRNGSDRMERIFERILTGEIPENHPINYKRTWKKKLTPSFLSGIKKSDKISAIVYIQKYSTTTGRIPNSLHEAAKKHGTGIPVFAIITHIDEIEGDQDRHVAIEKEREILANDSGIDKANIFTIANVDTRAPEEQDDPERNKHALEILRTILAAAKVFKKGEISI
ncbi:uncharacterized protein [Ptychodera flava]|uniref:uncharacterized protein n=1 Tax=Ptychodera flava TaxID=63121 RepID=UPI00396A2AC9